MSLEVPLSKTLNSLFTAGKDLDRRSLRAGLHLIEVVLDEVSVPKSPFKVSVAEGCDPSRVRAYGPGLEEGLVNKPNRFTVETR